MGVWILQHDSCILLMNSDEVHGSKYVSHEQCVTKQVLTYYGPIWCSDLKAVGGTKRVHWGTEFTRLVDLETFGLLVST